jgi:hypothetical protein
MLPDRNLFPRGAVIQPVEAAPSAGARAPDRCSAASCQRVPNAGEANGGRRQRSAGRRAPGFLAGRSRSGLRAGSAAATEGAGEEPSRQRYGRGGELVGEIAAAAEELTSQAAHLQGAVASFTLDRASGRGGAPSGQRPPSSPKDAARPSPRRATPGAQGGPPTARRTGGIQQQDRRGVATLAAELLPFDDDGPLNRF